MNIREHKDNSNLKLVGSPNAAGHVVKAVVETAVSAYLSVLHAA